MLKLSELIANREDPDQTASKKQSDLGLHCLSRPFFAGNHLPYINISSIRIKG